MAKQGPPEGGTTNRFLSALMITLSQAGRSESMAETELRAKEVEWESPAVVVSEVKIPRLRPGLRSGYASLPACSLGERRIYRNQTWVRIGSGWGETDSDQ